MFRSHAGRQGEGVQSGLTDDRRAGDDHSAHAAGRVCEDIIFAALLRFQSSREWQ
jgi:hypothetical protein